MKKDKPGTMTAAKKKELNKAIKKRLTVRKTPSTTNVHFILDKSGSMGSVAKATISGFNEYIDTLKADKNKYNVTLTVFDTEVEILEKATPIAKVKKLTSETYIPSGMTALYDAVCMTVSPGVLKNGKDGTKNLVVIMTDGEENSSKEYTMEEMKVFKDRLEKKGNWSFIFLGANQDAWIAGSKFGMARGNVATYNSSEGGMMRTMSMVADNTKSFSCSALNSTDNYFSDSDKKDLKKAK